MAASRLLWIESLGEDDLASHFCQLLVKLHNSATSQVAISLLTKADRTRLAEKCTTPTPMDMFPALELPTGPTVLRGCSSIASFLSLSGSPSVTPTSSLSCEEEGEVWQWMNFCVSELRDVALPSSGRTLARQLHFLSSHLILRVFLVGSQCTLADLRLFSCLYPLMKRLSKEERVNYCNLIRWFDHIQHLLKDFLVFPVLSALAVDDVVIEEKPLTVGKEHKKKKEESGAAEKAPDAAAPEKKEGGEGAEENTADMKKSVKFAPEKKQKEPKEPKEPKEADVAEEKDVPVDKMDVRVGQIKKVWKHPDADGLYVEEIDVGDPEGVRTVVSGLVKFVPIEEMLNRILLVCCNLKPAKMRGILSAAMVLAASNEDHTAVELLKVPDGVRIGERVTFAGFSGEPDKQLRKEKSQAIVCQFHTDAAGVAHFRDVPFMTSKGLCTSSLCNAHIS